MSDKAKQLPWKLWVPDDLATQSDPEIHEEVQDIAPTPAIAQVMEEDLARLREKTEKKAREAGFAQGRQEGFDAGLAEGREEGRSQGREEAQRQQEPLIEQLRQIVTGFQQALDDLDNVIPARLLQLALSAAKQVVGQPAVCDASALLTQIQQLIQQEPMFGGKPQLRVHPSDLARVEQYLGPTLEQYGWRLLADNQLHPGGCKVSAEDGDLDASLATRWHELCRLAAPGEL